MGQYRKKPVIISAIQWGGDNFEDEFLPLVILACEKSNTAEHYTFSKEGLVIHTLEGDMFVNIGDWVIVGIKGEMYPCKPDIFEATYENTDVKG